MSGGSEAVKSGKALESAVAKLGSELGLNVKRQYKVGLRLWGRERYIDLVFIDPETRKILGVECKYQGVGGTAEEKIPAVLQDIKAWPIPGLVVFDGPGFSEKMKSFLISSGIAVEFSDLKPWLALFFGIDI